MKLFFLFLALFSFRALAQFEDFDNILAPSTLTPKVGIICKAQVMFSYTDLIIDVKNGVVSQVAGDKKYTYRINSFAFEKTGKKEKLKLSLKGDLVSVQDSETGKELETKVKEGSFLFSSTVPTKNGKTFKANEFELSSNVRFDGNNSFNISSKGTNSTACELIKGGDYIKDLSKNTSVKLAGEYPKPEIDNSDRNQMKEISRGSGKTQKATKASEQ